MRYSVGRGKVGRALWIQFRRLHSNRARGTREERKQNAARKQNEIELFPADLPVLASVQIGRQVNSRFRRNAEQCNKTGWLGGTDRRQFFSMFPPRRQITV